MSIDIMAFITPIFEILKSILFIILKIVVPIILIFIILIIFWRLYFVVVKKIKPKPNKRGRFVESHILKKIFYDFPRQFALDRLNKDWDEFDVSGIHVFCGEQGSGKTMAMVYMMRKYQKIYPKLKVYTNFSYAHENGILESWTDMIKYKNGRYGIINAVDEIQTWFSNADSKDVPPAMIAEISQQRKQRKVTMCTAQVFSRIAKPFREQVKVFYFPRTFFGCVTFVRYAYGRDYNEKLDKFKRYAGWFVFVQNEEIRNCYDTYKKISKYEDQKFATSLFWGDPATVPEPQDRSTS